MKPRMSVEEIGLFTALLRSSSRYAEFGCGGSTVLAAGLVGEEVVAVDSSKAWIDNVRKACEPHEQRVAIQLHYIDIGPIGAWGYPTDTATLPRWSDYHVHVWNHVSDADLYLVDGRFRVACFLQTLLRCRPDAIIAFHDYRSRRGYHVVEQFARPISEAGDLTAFQRRTNWNPADVTALLLKHAFNAA